MDEPISNLLIDGENEPQMGVEGGDNDGGGKISFLAVGIVIFSILVVILGIYFMVKIARENYTCDIINEKNLSNCLYYQQPYGKLGGPQ